MSVALFAGDSSEKHGSSAEQTRVFWVRVLPENILDCAKIIIIGNFGPEKMHLIIRKLQCVTWTWNFLTTF